MSVSGAHRGRGARPRGKSAQIPPKHSATNLRGLVQISVYIAARLRIEGVVIEEGLDRFGDLPASRFGNGAANS